MPLGRHKVIIYSSDIKANKSEQGGLVEFGLRIIEGPLSGHEGVHRLNLYHQSQQTAEIAQKQFSALCHVTGVFLVQATEQLHNIPFIVQVENQKLTVEQQERASRGEQVTPFTQVTKVFDVHGNEPGKAGQGPAPAQQQPQGQPPAQQGNWQGGNAGPSPAPAPNTSQWGAQGGQPAAQPPAQGNWQGGAAAPVAAPVAAPAQGNWQQGGNAGAPPAGPAANSWARR